MLSIGVSMELHEQHIQQMHPDSSVLVSASNGRGFNGMAVKMTKMHQVKGLPSTKQKGAVVCNPNRVQGTC